LRYLPTGVKKNIRAPRAGAERAAAMLLRKIAGEPFRSEIEVPRMDDAAPAAPVADMRRATLALVTSGGIVAAQRSSKSWSARASPP
jgi:glycine/betaine/sarcosine/D-proline reductase family selenoprotein B